jgi:diguanylate cyclase (GGDEF)-like protein/PAS domain S-box-containing protein
MAGPVAGDWETTRRRAGWWVLLALALVLVLLDLVLPDPADDVVRVIGYVLAATVATAGLRLNRPGSGRAWPLIVAGMWVGALGQILWRYTSADLLHDPRGAIAVVVGLIDTVAFGLLFLGLLLLSTTGQRTLRRRARVLDTGIVAFAAAFLAYELVGNWAVSDSDQPALIWIGLAFVVLTIAVGFAAVPIAMSGNGRPASLAIGAGIGLLLLTDVLFVVDHTTTSTDVSWPVLLGLALVAGAGGILHPSMTRIGTDPPPVDEPLTAEQLAVGGLALLIPALIIGAADLVSHHGVGSTATVAVYLAGMAVLLRSRTRLLVTEGRRSDERFRQYFSLPLIGMLISGPDGRALDVNDRFCLILGRTRDDLIGTRIEELVHPDDLERDRPRLVRLTQGQVESVVSQRRFRRPDGSEVFARCTDNAALDEDGNLEYILGLVEDVTEAHLADERMTAHLALQDIVLQIAERFVNIDAADVDRAIDEALADLGHQCDIETAVLLEQRDDRAQLTHAWRTDTMVADPAATEDLFTSLSLLEQVAVTGAAVLESPDELLPQWDAAAELMRTRGVHSLVLLPLVAEDIMLGAIALTRYHDGPPWSTDAVELLKLAAEVFAQTLVGRRTASALAESEARNRSVVEAAADGIVTVDHRGNIRTFNPAAEALTGWMAAEVVGRPAELLLPEDERHELARYLGAASSRERASDKIELDGLRRDGRRFPLELTVSPVELPDGPGITVIARDVSDRKRLEAQLTHQALHDPLTGLANRTLLLDRLGTSLRRAQRSGAYPLVLFIDLDRFKVINDSLGHHVGDELLVVVARRLDDELRSGDTAARLGGDEFVVVCEGIGTVEQAEALADRILAAISQPVDLERAQPVVTASIGIIRAELGSTPETLLRDADASMYRAKEYGRNRAHHFDESVHGAAIDRLQLESGLRHAIAHDELCLYLQPQYAVDDLRPLGAEALLRWNRPGEGMLSPDRFLAVAEEVGLDVEIDRWVLTEGCRHARRCRERNPDFVVWVNLSARLLADPVLPGLVFSALSVAGLAPANLGIEVTERALVQDLDVAATSLDELRTAGVGIAIDDFGTGFSSLSWLERLPLDVLKIDRSFINGLGASRDDTIIVRSVIAMAHSLGLAALAEGVETLEQLARLRELDCDEFQGFLAARPMPFEHVYPDQHARLAPSIAP